MGPRGSWLNISGYKPNGSGPWCSKVLSCCPNQWGPIVSDGKLQVELHIDDLLVSKATDRALLLTNSKMMLVLWKLLWELKEY